MTTAILIISGFALGTSCTSLLFTIMAGWPWHTRKDSQ